MHLAWLFALAPSMADAPAWTLTDLGVSAVVPVLHTGPDGTVHLLATTADGFVWRTLEDGVWTDRGLVPETAGMGQSKFNNPSIAALGDGSFHVVWGPQAVAGETGGVSLASHDGAAWAEVRTLRDEYTEYIALAPAGETLLLVGANVWSTDGEVGRALAYTRAQPGSEFPAWVTLDADGEEKTPRVSVHGDEILLVTRYWRASLWRWADNTWSEPIDLLADPPDAVAFPTVARATDGSLVVGGTEYVQMEDGTWALDHLRVARASGWDSEWTEGGLGEALADVVDDHAAIVADHVGGVHLLYVPKENTLVWRHEREGAVNGPTEITSELSLFWPETDGIATTATRTAVHAVFSVAGTLHHLRIETGDDGDSGGLPGDTAEDTAEDTGVIASEPDKGRPTASPGTRGCRCTATASAERAGLSGIIGLPGIFGGVLLGLLALARREPGPTRRQRGSSP